MLFIVCVWNHKTEQSKATYCADLLIASPMSTCQWLYSYVILVILCLSSKGSVQCLEILDPRTNHCRLTSVMCSWIHDMLEFVCRVCYNVFQQSGERTQVKNLHVVHSIYLKWHNRAIAHDKLCRSLYSIAKKHLSMTLLLCYLCLLYAWVAKAPYNAWDLLILGQTVAV